jgi:hypothetical protein
VSTPPAASSKSCQWAWANGPAARPWAEGAGTAAFERHAGPRNSFRFLIPPGFQKASELSVEVANVQYFEGGSLIPNKSPGRLTFSDVTLERGATQDRDL